jgi:ATP-dependent DNA helicase DinG
VNTLPSLKNIFASYGPLAAARSGFELRDGQVRMAALVERGILDGMHTIVEAGTGVGKSLAYLIPALRSGLRVVISTGTIALQEQLVRKDIPFVADALGLHPRVELMKGRSHYLCRTKLDGMRAGRLFPPSDTMERIWDWADATQTGDRVELDFVPSAHEWEQLDVDADECIAELCPRYGDCWYFGRREAARSANILVVNHALFFLDVVSAGALLPTHDVAILDEAHQCERWATDALTARISQATVGRLMRRLQRSYTVPSAVTSEIESAVRRLNSTLAANAPGERYALEANHAARETLDELGAALSHLENWLHASWESGLHRVLPQPEAERRRDLSLRAVGAQLDTIERTRRTDDAISWVERRDGDGGAYDVNSAPSDIAGFLRTELFGRVPSVVLTSATIAEAGSFAFLKRTLGIDEAQEAVVASPFDYDRQARLYVAPSDCNPKHTNFARRVAPLVEEALQLSSGRAFVLFTSYKRLHEVFDHVRERIPYPMRLQGELPRTRLLEWFRTTPGAVLFATSSFWEGIDVIGSQLSCVIIDRLPFPSPSDPIVAARLAAIDASGGASFEEYMIPAATVRLKQGFGRLIRSTSDHGALILLDGRAASMNYGTAILEALPPARRILDLEELRGFFDTPRSDPDRSPRLSKQA